MEKRQITDVVENLLHSPVLGEYLYLLLPYLITLLIKLLGIYIKFQQINALNAELNPICHLLALLGVHNFPHVSRIRVKSLTLRLLMSYIYGAPILDVSRSHTTTHHSR